MDPELSDRLLSALKAHFLPILLGVLGLSFILYGTITHFSRPQTEGIVFEKGSEANQTEVKKPTGTITVDIAGAVIKPGVYTLANGARLQDLLIRAGGLSDQADRERIAKSINLASVLHDSMKIYIPIQGEAGQARLDSGQGVAGSSTTSDGLININEATSTELDSLPGVGSVTAEKIIKARPYEKIEDLVSKKAVSLSVFEKIKEKIGVY